MIDLLGRWRATLGVAGSAAPADDQRAAGVTLLTRWAEPHRAYHTTTHLAAMLSTMDELLAGDTPAGGLPTGDTDAGQPATAGPVAAQPATGSTSVQLAARDLAGVQLAAWFHDAVYDPLRGDNEDVSAALAETVLTALAVPAGLIAEAARLVRVTAAHEPAADDHSGALLCDADLAILAAPPSAYRRYAEAVRAEYAHLDNATFRAGRAAVLRRLLARPSLFNLAATRDKWERRARINLAIELSALTAGLQARKPHHP